MRQCTEVKAVRGWTHDCCDSCQEDAAAGLELLHFDDVDGAEVNSCCACWQRARGEKPWGYPMKNGDWAGPPAERVS